MHLVLCWLPRLTERTKGSKFLRGLQQREAPASLQMGNKDQEWPNHLRSDTNSGKNDGSWKPLTWAQAKCSSFEGNVFIKQCLLWWVLLVSFPELALSSFKLWIQQVTGFCCSHEMAPCKWAGSKCPCCPAGQKVFIWVPTCDFSQRWNQPPWEPARCPKTSWVWDQGCLSGRGILPSTGHWVKSGQTETQELPSKMSWPVFSRRSSRWSVCLFWPLNLLIYFPFQEI